MSEKIVFNGKSYDSLEQMPPRERKAYQAIKGIFADLDGNGVPNIFNEGTVVQVESTRSQIIFEGQRYENIETLPPEAQAKYRAAMARLDADGNGIPDLVEERLGLGSEKVDEQMPDRLISSIHASGDRTSSPIPSPVINSTKNIEPEGVDWRMVIINAVLAGLVILGAVTLWFYLAQ